MNQYIKFVLSCFLIMILPFFVFSQTVEEIIEKHIEAHGGIEKWQKVDALKIKGNFTGFSLEKPFHAVKTREGKYYADLYLGEINIKEAFNGKEGWTIDPWQEIHHARKLNGNEINVFLQKAQFFTPFFNYKEKGIEVEYQGLEKLDGMNMHVLKIKRLAGQVETWYLDAETYLEYSCVSQWVDFAWPSQAESFFDDFREVDGLVIPFFTDRTFGQRNRILQIEKIEINPEVDEVIFEMPGQEEMEMLSFLEGSWNVSVEVMTGAGNWYPIGKSTSSFIYLNKNLLEENIQYERIFPISRTLTFSYHNTSKKYRVGIFNDLSLEMELFEGSLTDTGFVFDNLGITYESVENPTHSKVEIHRQEEKGFIMTVYGSRDKGENWHAVDRFTYTPIEE